MLTTSGTASSAILIDAFPGPDAQPPGGYLGNDASGANLLVNFTLLSDVELTGLSILSPVNVAPGTLGRFKLRNDVAGNPTAANLYSFDVSLSMGTPFVADNWSLNQYVAEFAPIALSAGTYWAGLSGTSGSLGWQIFSEGESLYDHNGAILYGDVFSHVAELDFPFRVFGDIVTASPTPAIPEPATWTMLLTGFGLAGAAMRRRQQVAVHYA